MTNQPKLPVTTKAYEAALDKNTGENAVNLPQKPHATDTIYGPDGPNMAQNKADFGVSTEKCQVGDTSGEAFRSTAIMQHRRADELAIRPEIQVLCRYLFPEHDDVQDEFSLLPRKELAAEAVLAALAETAFSVELVEYGVGEGNQS